MSHNNGDGYSDDIPQLQELVSRIMKVPDGEGQQLSLYELREAFMENYFSGNYKLAKEYLNPLRKRLEEEILNLDMLESNIVNGEDHHSGIEHAGFNQQSQLSEQE